MARRPVERRFRRGREESQAFPVNILHVVPRIPFPADSGGTLRALQLLRALDAAFEVTVLAPELPGGDARGLRAELRGRVMTARETGGTAGWALCRGQQRARRTARSATPGTPGGTSGAAFRHLLAEAAVDLVHFDHVHAAQLLPEARALAPRARTVMDAHNVEAQVAERLAERLALAAEPPPAASGGGDRPARDAHGPGRGRGPHLLGARRRGAPSCRCARGASRPQRRRAAPAPGDPGAAGHGRLRRLVRLAAQRRTRRWSSRATSGRGCVRPAPGCGWRSIGRKPPPLVRQLAADDIEVTGRVDDVAPWLAPLLRHRDAAPGRARAPGSRSSRPRRRAFPSSHPARLRGAAVRGRQAPAPRRDTRGVRRRAAAPPPRAGAAARA